VSNVVDDDPPAAVHGDGERTLWTAAWASRGRRARPRRTPSLRSIAADADDIRREVRIDEGDNHTPTTESGDHRARPAGVDAPDAVGAEAGSWLAGGGPDTDGPSERSRACERRGRQRRRSRIVMLRYSQRRSDPNR
jgi:hypothetical protein